MDFSEHPVIAAVRGQDAFSYALSSLPECLFLLNSDLLTLREHVDAAHKAEKRVFVHVDFTEGLGKDKIGLKLLRRLGADGVITTRSGIVKLAREEHLMTVQRFFMVDSHSFDTAVEAVRVAEPDMIEVMPGLVTREITALKKAVHLPVIAGGLLKSRQEVYAALAAGASAVSTGCMDLWNA